MKPLSITAHRSSFIRNSPALKCLAQAQVSIVVATPQWGKVSIKRIIPQIRRGGFFHWLKKYLLKKLVIKFLGRKKSTSCA